MPLRTRIFGAFISLTLGLSAACNDDDGSAGATPDPTGTGGSGGSSAGNGAFDGSCRTLPGTVVYVESGDTQENLLKRLGRKLRDTADITLAYNLTGSCTLANDIYTGVKMVPNGTLKYVPSSEEDPGFTPSMAAPTCTTPEEGVPIDVAISALFVESCGLGGPPEGSGLALIQGPVQAYTFIVPTASDQSAIWAEEAYYAFGFGDDNPLAPEFNPWNQEEFMFIRPPTKSTLVATALNIDVPPVAWKGVPEMASSDVVNAVASSSNPQATIGILGAEVFDALRGPTPGIKTLAFQAYDQDAAYFPDSSSSAFDKQNVRDGHYTLWSPTVYITAVDDDGLPRDPAARYFIDVVLGTPGAVPPNGGEPIDGLSDVIGVGLIPDCAMQVTRSEDGGDLSPYTPAAPCVCSYLSQVPDARGATEGCSACEEDSDCEGDRSCNHGFCEPRALETDTEPERDCFEGTPSTHEELMNACTEATSIEKNIELPEGGLEPLP
jgi:hypothetical protein